MLTEGAGGIQALREQADELGLTLSQTAADDATDFRDALATQLVCDAVLESARSRRWVDVPAP